MNDLERTRFGNGPHQNAKKELNTNKNCVELEIDLLIHPSHFSFVNISQH